MVVVELILLMAEKVAVDLILHIAVIKILNIVFQN